MRDLLFISHRIPWPPDKGEKIRSFNLLKHLSRDYRIHLGCLLDKSDDAADLPLLEQWCTTVAGFRLDKKWQKWLALARIRPGRPLMLDYYRHPGLIAWVRETMARTRMDVVYVYTVAMMPYLDGLHRPGMVLDAVDIDSEKWTTYAGRTGFPMRLVWRREGRTLLAYERWAAMQCDTTLFVSAQETGRFAVLAPESAGRVEAVENGVDLERFSPGLRFERPFSTPGPHVVFTGHMDYWPNSDAAVWFVSEVMPLLRGAYPGIEFHVVGANPGAEVVALGAVAGVSVTGRVADVRPFVAHADVSVAPLRIARGIQNKVLEAMAMGRPTVVSPQGFEGVRAEAGRDLLVGEDAAGMATLISEVLEGRHPELGANGRRAMENGYAWEATLVRLDEILSRLPTAA